MIEDLIEDWAILCEDDEIRFPPPSFPIKPFVVHVTDDKSFLKTFRNEIFEMIRDAYSDKGGFLGADNPRTLIKDTDVAKLVFDDSGNIIACALYRTDMGGFKRFGSAGLKGNPKSLKAVEDIIKTDIEPYNGWYWVEASETIERIFKENDGNPIPNSLAEYFLEMENGSLEPDSDGIHYFRTIDGSKKRKMLFGFKNEESKRMAEEAVMNYGEFKLRTNNMDDRVDESNSRLKTSLEEARRFLSRLFDMHYEDRINEMLPSWHDRLVYSMKLIADNIDIVSSSERPMYKSALKRGKTCMDSMTILKFKKISI